MATPKVPPLPCLLGRVSLLVPKHIFWTINEKLGLKFGPDKKEFARLIPLFHDFGSGGGAGRN